jgi:hypothetical protein
MRMYWDREPTPSPSQEGSSIGQPVEFPSWEGSGVGWSALRFKEGMRWSRPRSAVLLAPVTNSLN